MQHVLAPSDNIRPATPAAVMLLDQKLPMHEQWTRTDQCGPIRVLPDPNTHGRTNDPRPITFHSIRALHVRAVAHALTLHCLGKSVEVSLPRE